MHVLRRVQSFTSPPARARKASPAASTTVDLVLGVRIGNRVRDLAVATDRGRDKLRVYEIDPVRALSASPPCAT